MITWQDFEKTDIRTGTITEAVGFVNTTRPT